MPRRTEAQRSAAQRSRARGAADRTRVEHARDGSPRSGAPRRTAPHRAAPHRTAAITAARHRTPPQRSPQRGPAPHRIGHRSGDRQRGPSAGTRTSPHRTEPVTAASDFCRPAKARQPASGCGPRRSAPTRSSQINRGVRTFSGRHLSSPQAPQILRWGPGGRTPGEPALCRHSTDTAPACPPMVLWASRTASAHRPRPPGPPVGRRGGEK